MSAGRRVTGWWELISTPVNGESGLDPVLVGRERVLKSLSKFKAKAGCTFSTPGTLWPTQHRRTVLICRVRRGKNLPSSQHRSTTMSTPDQTSLLKLPREQLKQLCKERGHTGYSKCTKPQLVALLGSDTPSKFDSSTMTTVVPPKQGTSSSASASKKRPEPGPSGTGELVSKKQRRLNAIPPSSNPSTQSSMISVPPKAKRKSRLAQKILHDSPVSPVPTTPAAVPPLDQRPTFPPVSRLLPPPTADHSLSLPQPPELRSQSQTTLDSQPHTRVVEKQEIGTSFPATSSFQQQAGGDGRTRRFRKFLDPRNSVTSSNLAPCGPPDILHSINLPSTSNVSVEPLPAPYLDFLVLPVPVLGLIGMPPSISDRKNVRSWSIILSGIPNTERRTCILVSRMFRYAGKSPLQLPSRVSHLHDPIVYLSASVILISKFPGKRLDDVTRTYSPSMFNLWPYLRARETELAEQRSLYLRSFLHRFYETFEPIDRRLWASPDNPKQYAVAVR